MMWCGDDSHPGEEIYTPSGDEATTIRRPITVTIRASRDPAFMYY